MLSGPTTTPVPAPAAIDWRGVVARYQRSDTRRAIAQIATTLPPLAALFYLMYRSLALPYWVTLILAVPAAGLLVRTFIIMHDCAHGSFTPSRGANEAIGWVTGLITMTAFPQWRHDHSLHHASSGDLDRRGHGDIETLTVKEYLALPRRGRFRYRFIRNPLVMFGLGPIHWVLTNRFPAAGTARRLRISVLAANLGILTMFAVAALFVGWKAVFLIFAPAMYIAVAAGIWLFYVQHQFEDTYWEERGEWDYATAAIRGSSHLALPAMLNWFTGSIGMHHVHHLGPRIPNYALRRCHDESGLFGDVTVLTMSRTLSTLRLTLWDEGRQRLVGFRDIAITASTR